MARTEEADRAHRGGCVSAHDHRGDAHTGDGKAALFAFSAETLAAFEELIDRRIEERLAEREGQPCGWLTVRGAAAHLGWSPKRIYNYLHELPHVRHGGRLMFRAPELDRAMERHREEVQP